MDRDTFHQTRLLQALSSLALNPTREGATTASLGNLCQGLTTLIVNTTEELNPSNFLKSSCLNRAAQICRPIST